MPTISVTINKCDILAEVSKMSDYVGSKALDRDDSARDRILATDNALKDLNRFWQDAIMKVNERFKLMITSSVDTDGQYILTLEVSKSFDIGKSPEVKAGITSYLINDIIGQWFAIVNKAEAAEYAALSADLLAGVERTLYSRKKPSVPTD